MHCLVIEKLDQCVFFSSVKTNFALPWKCVTSFWVHGIKFIHFCESFCCRIVMLCVCHVGILPDQLKWVWLFCFFNFIKQTFTIPNPYLYPSTQKSNILKNKKPNYNSFYIFRARQNWFSLKSKRHIDQVTKRTLSIFSFKFFKRRLLHSTF